MTLKDRAKRLLRVWLEEIEKRADAAEGLDKIPRMDLDQYRTVATVLAAYRAGVDERALEDDLKRPRFSLDGVSGDELRVAIVAGKKQEEAEEWKKLSS
jgi:hypothetical protein